MEPSTLMPSLMPDGKPGSMAPGPPGVSAQLVNTSASGLQFLSFWLVLSGTACVCLVSTQ